MKKEIIFFANSRYLPLFENDWIRNRTLPFNNRISVKIKISARTEIRQSGSLPPPEKMTCKMEGLSQMAGRKMERKMIVIKII